MTSPSPPDEAQPTLAQAARSLLDAYTYYENHVMQPMRWPEDER
jgi:hypothetical protein